MLLPMEKVVYPQFMFLDDAGNPIRNVSHTAVFNGSDFWRGAYFKGEMEVPSGARRLVVHASRGPMSSWTLDSDNGTLCGVEPAVTGHMLIKLMKP
jgi:hypothetical protein